MVRSWWEESSWRALWHPKGRRVLFPGVFAGFSNGQTRSGGFGGASLLHKEMLKVGKKAIHGRRRMRRSGRIKGFRSPKVCFQLLNLMHARIAEKRDLRNHRVQLFRRKRPEWNQPRYQVNQLLTAGPQPR